MFSQFILYHGTTQDNAEKILKEGFKARACLTSDLEVAEYYAECACDEDGLSYEECAIVAVTVERDSLVVDYPAYEEPLSFYKHNYTTSDREWREMIENAEIPYPRDEKDIDTALEVTTCVRVSSKVDGSLCSLKD
ncbi:hypothetical protein [Vibrio crassostreae]|uniref:hypothetical protein n=1 Tax=Vibrio crassostreae TaxID=246167 RepID=UPI001B306AFF|nr:hypothetical protein [Vibrio crassostreae]